MFYINHSETAKAVFSLLAHQWNIEWREYGVTMQDWDENKLALSTRPISKIMSFDN